MPKVSEKRQAYYNRQSARVGRSWNNCRMPQSLLDRIFIAAEDAGLAPWEVVERCIDSSLPTLYPGWLRIKQERVIALSRVGDF